MFSMIRTLFMRSMGSGFPPALTSTCWLKLERGSRICWGGLIPVVQDKPG